MHGGIQRIKIDVDADTLCVIGNNGSGKSTMLGELHPFPAVSSSYASGGYKRLHVTHDDSNYVLTSTFEGRSITHSFVKDTVELNDSGTTGVQNELCYREFGINDAIKTLLQGVVDICKMPLSQRKSFLMSCYPTDLTFLLDHHKRVGSTLRGIKSNIKMLLGRLAELEQEAIPQGAYDALLANLDELDSFKERAIRAMAIYEAELAKTVADPNYDPDAPVPDMEIVQNHIRSFCQEVSKTYRKNPRALNDNPGEQASSFRTRSEMLSQEQQKVSSEITDLLQEINRFEELSREMANDRVQEQLNLIGQLKAQEALDQLKLDEKIKVFPLSHFYNLDMEFLKRCAITFGSLEQPLLNPVKYAALEDSIRQLVAEESGHRMELIQLKDQRRKLEAQVNSSQLSNFRPNCTLACPAREDVTKIHEEQEKELREVIQLTEKVEKSQAKLLEHLEKKRVLYEANKEAQPWLVKFVRMLDPIESAFGDKEPLVDRVIKNPMGIYNYINRLHDNSKVHASLTECRNSLEREEQLLVTLQESRKEKQELLDRMNTGNEDRVGVLRKRHTELKQSVAHAQQQVVFYEQLIGFHGRTDELSKYVEQTITTALVNRKAEWLTQVLEELRMVIQITEEEQISTKSTLKGQEAIQIRIEQEIKPNLKELTEERERMEILEKALSPIDGIPHVYMVRFMNNVMEYVNLIIGQVWTYDMELEKLQESNRMDYNFGISLNSGTPLKDISWLSRAQSEITNLAFSWALYKVMKLGDRFPMKMDEADAGFTTHHRTKLLTLISGLLTAGEIKQLILVNHHSTLFSGFPQAQICVLAEEGIVLPNEYNRNVVIE